MPATGNKRKQTHTKGQKRQRLTVDDMDSIGKNWIALKKTEENLLEEQDEVQVLIEQGTRHGKMLEKNATVPLTGPAKRTREAHTTAMEAHSTRLSTVTSELAEVRREVRRAEPGVQAVFEEMSKRKTEEEEEKGEKTSGRAPQGYVFWALIVIVSLLCGVAVWWLGEKGQYPDLTVFKKMASVFARDSGDILADRTDGPKPDPSLSIQSALPVPVAKVWSAEVGQIELNQAGEIIQKQLQKLQTKGTPRKDLQLGDVRAGEKLRLNVSVTNEAYTIDLVRTFTSGDPLSATIKIPCENPMCIQIDTNLVKDWVDSLNKTSDSLTAS